MELETVKNGSKDKDQQMEQNGVTSTPEKRKPCSDFDDILALIGPEGRYQKLLVYAFLAPLIALAPLFELSAVFLLDVPDHWCHVPGNFTDDLAIWKNVTLPSEIGPDGSSRFMQCHMFDDEDLNFENRRKIPCKYGWDFDKTDYESTIPSAHLWICDKANYATDVLSVGAAGAAVGTIVFGMLADRIGRKPVFFMAVAVNAVFRSISLFVPQFFMTYQTLWFITGMAFPTLYTIPSMHIAEVSGADYRSWIYAVVWMVWVLGNCILPVMAWISRVWFILGACCALPGYLILGYWPLLMESPRWLITVGQGKRALKILKRIAKINGAVDADDATLKGMVTDLIAKQKGEDLKNEQALGLWTLFRRPRLARNTILLCIAWSMNTLLYSGITLNTTSMAGNKFLNYFALSLIELPSGYLAGVLVEKTGRRWTQVAFFAMCAFSCFLSATAIYTPGLPWLEIIGAFGIKFGVSVSSLVVYLQGTEIFPTQLRSTGAGFASTVACLVGITAPYIVFTGKVDASLPYSILGVLSIVGMLCSSFLPETLHQHLPETVDDAEAFGADCDYFSYLPPKGPREEKDKGGNEKHC